MKTHIIIFNWETLKSEESIVLERLLNKAWEGTELSFETITLKSIALSNKESLKHLTADYYFALGERARNFIQEYISNIVLLPKPSELIDIPENEDKRFLAWDIVQNTKNKSTTTLNELENLKIISEDLETFYKTSFSNLSSDLIIEAKTKSGHKVVISNKKPDTKNFDFHLTLEELYAAKYATQILKLDTLVISKGNKND